MEIEIKSKDCVLTKQLHQYIHADIETMLDKHRYKIRKLNVLLYKDEDLNKNNLFGCNVWATIHSSKNLIAKNYSETPYLAAGTAIHTASRVVDKRMHRLKINYLKQIEQELECAW